MEYATFYFNFNAKIITLLSIRSVKADYYAFTNPFRWGFKPYTNAFMAFSVPSLGSTTTMLSKAVMYSNIELYCCSSHDLSLAIFLSSSVAY